MVTAAAITSLATSSRPNRRPRMRTSTALVGSRRRAYCPMALDGCRAPADLAELLNDAGLLPSSQAAEVAATASAAADSTPVCSGAPLSGGNSCSGSGSGSGSGAAAARLRLLLPAPMLPCASDQADEPLVVRESPSNSFIMPTVAPYIGIPLAASFGSEPVQPYIVEIAEVIPRVPDGECVNILHRRKSG